MKIKNLNNYTDYFTQQIIVSKYNAPDRLDLVSNYLIKKYNLSFDSYILDIGCRNGTGIKNLIDKGYKNSYGIDIGMEMIKNYGTDNFYSCDMHESIGFEHTFDLITIIHTLEHAYDVSKVLTNIQSSLKKDGILYIVIPKGEYSNPAHYIDVQEIEEFFPILNQLNYNIIETEVARNGTEFIYHCKYKN